MYPDLVARLEEACLHRDILESMSPFCDQPDARAGLRGKDWLLSRLEEVGLESCEDFGLLEEDDLLPDLDARVRELAADPFALTSLRKDFPASFTVSGARYRVKSVGLKRQRVVIEPANATAKKRGEPLPKMLPRYRSFSVIYEQASRVVNLR